MIKLSLQKIMNVHGVILDSYLFQTCHMTVWQKNLNLCINNGDLDEQKENYNLSFCVFYPLLIGIAISAVSKD